MAVSLSPKPKQRRKASRVAEVKIFSWAEDSRKPSRYATVFGTALDEIKNGTGRYKAAAIVEYARPATSPIHEMFEWNDEIAGEKYRKIQARSYVNDLVVEIVSNGKSVSMPVAFSFGPGDGYTDSRHVMETAELRQRLVAQALKEANSWRTRWKHLNELSNVFAAIEEVNGG